MKITKTKVDDGSLVGRYLPADYSDAFECLAPLADDLSPDDLLVEFWGIEKGWVKSLFRLRDVLVKPFGLKSADKDGVSDMAECVRKGGSHGILSVTDKAPDETVIVLNDKHLKAYMAVSINPSENDLKRVVVSTIVHFHNGLGRVYFYAIAPFHYLVVRSMLKSAIRRLSPGQ